MRRSPPAGDSTFRLGRRLADRERDDQGWGEPENLSKNYGLLDIFQSLKPDFFVVVSYGKMIPEKFFNIPLLASLNVHPSLLPKYRGPAPMEWALINGEKETGVSVILMTKEIDAGNIISSQKVIINPEDDIFILRKKLYRIASVILLDAIEKILLGYKGQQQTGDSSYAPKLKKTDGHINWNQNAVSIHNRIRGLADWPGAYTFVVSEGYKKMLKIKKSFVEDATRLFENPGRFIENKKRLLVSCGQGILELLRVQEEGKKEISSIEYLNGHYKIIKDGFLE